MTTIIYVKSTNKVIQIRHINDEDLNKLLEKFPPFEVVERWQDIRKINENIDTLEYEVSLKKWY